MLTPYSVFIVDDDAPMRDSLLMLLRGEGLRARAFVGAADFLNALPDDRYACVVTDVRMPGMEGPELIRRLGRCAATPGRSSSSPAMPTCPWPCRR